MAIKRLGEKNIDLLLNQYRGERKRLIFQLDKVRDTIAQLKAIKAQEGSKVSKTVSTAVERGPGRPRKEATSATVPAQQERRRKRRVKTGGYKLSNWDEMVINSIRKGGSLLPKEDIVKLARTWAAKNEPKMTASEVEDKITRVLQKLTGKRGLLGTHRSGLRRGYHYGLKEWFFATSGALRKQHLDKLDLKGK